jgi:hypothetical protein
MANMNNNPLHPFKVINNKSNVLVYEGNLVRREELCSRYVLHMTSGRERCINLTNSRRTPLSCHCFSAIDTMYKREAVSQWMVGYDLMSKVCQQAWLINLMQRAENNQSRPTYRATRQIYSLPFRSSGNHVDDDRDLENHCICQSAVMELLDIRKVWWGTCRSGQKKGTRPVHQLSGKPSNHRVKKLEAGRNLARLEQCAINAHAEIAAIWPKKETKTDVCDKESAILANAHYVDGVPEGRVKLLVLAESHAKTDPSALGMELKVHVDGLDTSTQRNLRHINLVHCLSYGEAWLLGEEQAGKVLKKQKAISSGTPEFWKVMSILAGETDDKDLDTNDDLKTNFTHLQKGSKKGSKKNASKQQLERINNKVNVLKKMKDRGIVLADISPTAIYVGGGTKLVANKTTGKNYFTNNVTFPAKSKKAILRTAWDHYSRHIVEELRPDYLMILGVANYDAIGEAELLRVTNQIGTQLLPRIQHPSCSGKSAEKKPEMYRQIRDAAKKASDIP